MAAKVKALQQWCKLQCEGYRDVDIKNMTSSWKSGLAFCAIIHKYRPDLIDYDSLSKENVFENNKLAFSVAKHLGIPALLDPEDMVIMTVPDKLCIVTYVSQYYNYFRNYCSVTSVKRHLPDDASPFVTAKKPILQTSAGQNSLQNQDFGNVKGSNDVAGSIKRHTMEDTCNACKNKVFLMERQIEGNKLYHRHCLRNMQKKQSSTLQLTFDAMVTGGSPDYSKNMKHEFIENEGNSVEINKTKIVEGNGEPIREHLSSAASDESCSKVVEPVSCTLTTVSSKITLSEDISQSHDKEPKPYGVSLSDQSVTMAIATESNSCSSIASTGTTEVTSFGVILGQFTPVTRETQQIEVTESVKSVFSTIVTSVHSNGSSYAHMTLSPESSAIIPNSFTHSKQSIATGFGHSVENCIAEIAHDSSSENISILQPCSGHSLIRKSAAIDTSSDQSIKAPIPMQPSAPSVTVLQSSSGSCVIPSKPPRSSVIIDACHDAFNESSKLTTKQSARNSTVVSFPSRSFQKHDSNTKLVESVSSSEKQPIQVKSHLIQGTLLSPTNSSYSVANDIHRASTVDNVLVSSAAMHESSPCVLNQSDSKTTTLTAGNTTDQNMDVQLNKSYQGSKSVITPAQSIKTPISHPARLPLASPTTPPTVPQTSALIAATSSFSESESMLNSRRSTKMSNFVGSVLNSAEVESSGNCVTSPSMRHEDSNKSISFDKPQEPDFSLKVSLGALPSEVHGKVLKSMNGRRISDECVVHSGSLQQNIKTKPAIVVLSKDNDEENCSLAKRHVISNLKSEFENQSISGIQHPPIRPRPGIKVLRDADGKHDLSVNNQEPEPKINDENSFGNKPPQIPKRPPSIVVSTEIDANNCVSNKRAQISQEYEENMDLYSILEEGERSKLKQSTRENPFNLSEKMTVLNNEKSNEFFKLNSSSSSILENKMRLRDIKSPHRNCQSEDCQGEDTNAGANVECQMLSKPAPSPKSILKTKREAPSPPVQSSGSTWYVHLKPSQFQNETEEVQEYVHNKKSISPVPLPRTKSQKEIDPAPPNGEPSKISMSRQSSVSPKHSGSNKFTVPPEGMAGVRTPPPRPTPPTAENVQLARKKITPNTEFTFENQCFNFGPTGNKKFSDGQELHMRTGAFVSSNNQPIVKRKVNAEDRFSAEYISAQLKFLDAELKKLEKDGRLLEDKIRSGTDESMDDDDKNDLMTHWFEMVNQKNDLVRQESDLIYRCRQQELEDQHEDVEFELRCLMNKPDNLKTASEKKREEMLLQKLLQTVSQRNSIIESIEEDRIRYLKEDEEIAQMLNSSHRF